MQPVDSDEELREFRALDVDNSNKLTKEEAYKLGMTEQEFEDADKDHSGEIDLEEWYAHKRSKLSERGAGY